MGGGRRRRGGGEWGGEGRVQGAGREVVLGFGQLVGELAARGSIAEQLDKAVGLEAREEGITGAAALLGLLADLILGCELGLFMLPNFLFVAEADGLVVVVAQVAQFFKDLAHAVQAFVGIGFLRKELAEPD